MVRMHSNEMEEISQASGGDVVAVFGVECGSMDTFTDGTCQLAMSSMFVPDPGTFLLYLCYYCVMCQAV